ncbi:MAG: methylated-DNA--[protein]-cysteine S-methyltransferase [Dysgonamonadaceae bacterium]|jgi:AraC family transcriptional regulator of adaptative response/methylated-DNA-[protein]-cysteine methyltransferase|nr:methylated-DNA--[protein]-cysteine S-methyltransferase [Dysgonamonadaceae bacterium]
MKQFSLIPMLPLEENGIGIQYDTYDTQFGKSVIASSEKGICYIAFGEEKRMLDELKQRYPKAKIIKGKTDFHTKALSLISGLEKDVELSLHVRGTDFQLNVWNALLQIPSGKTTTYKTIAERVGKPKATRAVGTAVGQNPISFFIPCHRVVRTDGGLGGYHWGIDIKKQMLGFEGGVKL